MKCQWSKVPLEAKGGFLLWKKSTTDAFYQIELSCRSLHSFAYASGWDFSIRCNNSIGNPTTLLSLP